MKKDQLAKLTTEYTVKKLHMMAEETDLNNPDKVLLYLANKKGKKGYIETLAAAYNRYVRYNGLKWKMPKFQRTSQPPYVPTTEEITIIISNSGTKYCMINSVFKDTGMRPIEIERCTRRWIDLKKGLIRVETAKYGLGRTLKLKSHTLRMLEEYLAQHNFKLDDHVFPTTTAMRRNIIKIRRRTAKKLHRPELEKICLYSFRHYFATKLYRDSNHNYVLVKKKLGHKDIKRTITYLQSLSEDIEESDFDSTTAETPKEALQLAKEGWVKFDEFDGIHLYKKRK